jgi:hypothetical protein
MYVKNANMENIHFNAKNVRVLVYVSMINTNITVKIVMGKIFVNITELSTIVKTVMEVVYVNIINDVIDVLNAKVEAFANTIN